jgi:hypothetical protein
MESRFGRDLSQVRVHTDAKAAESARTLNALAYTVRNDIVFGADQYSPHERRGRGLIAHELGHVLQQSSLAHPAVHYQKPDTGPGDVHPDPLNDVLPRGLGILAGLDRRFQLIDIFGEDKLAELVSEIKSNPSALSFTRKTGVLGLLALVDTRQGKKFDVAKAQSVLDADQKKPKPARRYTRVLLEPRPAAAKSFWFQAKPPEERAASGTEGEQNQTVAGESEKVVEDPRNPFRIRGAGDFTVLVNFAFMGSDMRGGLPSSEILDGEKAVLNGIGKAFQDLRDLPPASGRAARRADQQRRARLKEALRAFSSKPLRIFLSSNDSEELTGLALRTDTIYVRREDIGDQAKLEAAIRIPLVAFKGGIRAPGMNDEEGAEAVLHELVHALLIERHASANDVWETIKTGVVTGPPTVKNRCEELIHRYLVAQEEVFTYQNVSELGGSYSNFSSKNQPRYEAFIAETEIFLASKGVKLDRSKKKLNVAQRVGGNRVDWSIEIRYPGSLGVTGADLTPLTDLIQDAPGS